MPLLFTTLILPPAALDITPAWTAATHRGDDCNTEGKEDESDEAFLTFTSPNRDGQERTTATADELLPQSGELRVFTDVTGTIATCKPHADSFVCFFANPKTYQKRT